MWIVVVITVIGILVSVRILLKYIVQFVVSRLSRCTLTVDSIGWFSLKDCRITIDNVCDINMDYVGVGTNIFSANRGKPILIRVQNIRVEIKEVETRTRNESSTGKSNAMFDHFATVVQYFGLHVEELQLVVRDIGVYFPCTMLHVSAKRIYFDGSHHQRDARSALSVALLNLKLLDRSRSSSDVTGGGYQPLLPSNTYLLDLKLEVFVKVCLDVTERCIRSVKLDITRPEVVINFTLIKNFIQVYQQTTIVKQRNTEGSTVRAKWKPKKFRLDLSHFESKLVFDTNMMDNCIGFAIETTYVSLRESINELSTTIGLSHARCVALRCRIYDKDKHSLISCASLKTEAEKIASQKALSVKNVIKTTSIIVREKSIRDFYGFFESELRKYERLRPSQHQTRLSEVDPVSENPEMALSFTVDLGDISGKFEPITLEHPQISNDSMGFKADSICLKYFKNLVGNVKAELSSKLCWCYIEPIENFKPSFNQHHWNSVLYMATCVTFVEKTVNRLTIQTSCDESHLQLHPLLFRICHRWKTYLGSFQSTTATMPVIQNDTQMSYQTFLHFNKVAIILPSTARLECSVLFIQKFGLDNSKARMVVNLSGSNLHHMTCEMMSKWQIILGFDKLFSDVKADVVLNHCRILYDKKLAYFSVDAKEGIALRWNANMHMNLYTFSKQIKALFGPSQTTNQSSGSSGSRKKGIRLTIEKGVVICLQVTSVLNRTVNDTIQQHQAVHHISLDAPSVRMCYGATGAAKLEMPSVVCSFDSHGIVKLTTALFECSPNGLELLTKTRSDYPYLTTRSNGAWLVSLDMCEIGFPYGYDFATAFDILINNIKWLKVVHQYNKLPFTAQSPLPPDALFKIQKILFFLSDDPFELKLVRNYQNQQLLTYDVDGIENELRVQAMRGRVPLRSDEENEIFLRNYYAKIFSCYRTRTEDSIAEESRFEQKLFEWSIVKLELRLIADLSMHGRNNALDQIRALNPESPLSPDLNFVTLWCRLIVLTFDQWQMRMHDYKQPYFYFKDAFIYGKLAGAEQEGSAKAKRTEKISLGDAWGDYEVLRNMPALKFYYDLKTDVELCESTYGPCWEPCLSMISYCWDLINKPSFDPSPPLPFWDKIRLLFHGQFTMGAQLLRVNFLASSDPYNMEEELTMQWTAFAFHWQNAKLRFESECLDAFIRTASRYDSAHLAHFPNARLVIEMLWKCSADPNDHHSVSPCAADKLPEFSSNKDHDSYRAFRSNKVSIDYKIVLRSDRILDESVDDRIPKLCFYASTFRWLDTLKNNWSAVQRPIRRGRLFGRPRITKAQLSRHVDNFTIDLSLPTFLVNYRLSYGSQYSGTVKADRLILTSAHNISLRKGGRVKVSEYNGQSEVPLQQNEKQNRNSTTLPPEPNRHSRIVFETVSVDATLGTTQVFLFGEPNENKFSEKNKLMAISEVKYHRVAVDDIYSTKKTPLNKLTFYEFRGAWNTSIRDIFLAMFDGYQKSALLRDNLSTEALQTNIENPADKTGFGTAAAQRAGKSFSDGIDDDEPTKFPYKSDALLNLLLTEDETNRVVTHNLTEAVKPGDHLHGLLMCAGDVLFTNWEIELLQPQVAMWGVEVESYVLCTALKAKIQQNIHKPVWKDEQLLGKDSWCSSLSGMQYYSPVERPNDTANIEDKIVSWVKSDVLQAQHREMTNPSLDKIAHITGETTPGAMLSDTELLRIANAGQDCHIVFCHFSDTYDCNIPFDIISNAKPPPPPLDEDAGMSEVFSNGPKLDAVDCFILKHSGLRCYTNSFQYRLVLDIVDKLLLYVDPIKRQTAEELGKLRFVHKLNSVEDLLPDIETAQTDCRDLMHQIRSIERQLYTLMPSQEGGESDIEVLRQAYFEKSKDCKNRLNKRADELSMLIRCFKEKQMMGGTNTRQLSKSERVPVVVSDSALEIVDPARRFEVFFEDSVWGLIFSGADTTRRHATVDVTRFLYTKIARVNQANEHVLEVDDIEIRRIDKNVSGPVVLSKIPETSGHSRLAVRIINREAKKPVGGITIKDLFEVSIAPMYVNLTYEFFRDIMNYFFPGKNIDGDEVNSKSGVTKKSKNTATPKKRHQKHRSDESTEIDDITKMKQRSDENNFFVLLKIKEVPFTVTYKGEKEKNIEDVEDFHVTIETLEYVERCFTWLDLSLEIKRRVKSTLMSQYIKERVMTTRLMSGLKFGNPKQDISKSSDEDKQAFLLGYNTDKRSGRKK